MLYGKANLLRSFSSASASIQTLRQTKLANGLISLSVRQGDLIKETTEVIVNPANAQMRHTGTLASHIVKMGGDSIQDDSDFHLSQYGGLIPVG